MLYSSTESQVKHHIWKIFRSRFLFLKGLAGVVRKGFLTKRVHCISDGSVFVRSPVLMLICIFSKSAVEHRYLELSYFCLSHAREYTWYSDRLMQLQVYKSSLSGGGYGSPPRWPPYCRVETACSAGWQNTLCYSAWCWAYCLQKASLQFNIWQQLTFY